MEIHPIITDHSVLTSLAWSVAGHTIDAAVDFNDNTINNVGLIEGDDLDITGGTGTWSTSGTLASGTHTPVAGSDNLGGSSDFWNSIYAQRLYLTTEAYSVSKHGAANALVLMANEVDHLFYDTGLVMADNTDITLSGTGDIALGSGNISGSDLDISAGTGDYSSSGTGTFGSITIFNAIPILILKDSTYAGDVSLGYMEWRDSNNTRLGFFGNASSGNDDLFWKNESSGGHIKIETTGAGEVQIFADATLRATLGPSQLLFVDDYDVVLGGTGKVKVVGTEITDDQILMDTDKTITPMATGIRLTNSGAGEVFNLQLENDTTVGTVFQLPAGAATQVNAVPGANFDFTFFVNSADGENKTVYVYGFPTGIANKYGSFQMVDIGGANHFQISTEDAIPVSIPRITKIGDGGTTNYSEFEADGTLKFHGTATVWDDLPPSPIIGAKLGATAPTLATFVTDIQQYTFDATNDFVIGATEITHKWKEGTVLVPHIHWATNGSEGTAKGVQWQLKWTVGDITEAFSAQVTSVVDVTIDASTPDRTHYMSDFDTTLDGTNLKIGAYICWRLERIATAHGNGEPAADPFGIAIGFHGEMDTVGSRTITAK